MFIQTDIICFDNGYHILIHVTDPLELSEGLKPNPSSPPKQNYVILKYELKSFRVLPAIECYANVSMGNKEENETTHMKTDETLANPGSQTTKKANEEN